MDANTTHPIPQRTLQQSVARLARMWWLTGKDSAYLCGLLDALSDVYQVECTTLRKMFDEATAEM